MQLLPIMPIHKHLAQIETVESLDLHIEHANKLAEQYKEAVPALSVAAASGNIKAYKEAVNKRRNAEITAQVLRLFRSEICDALENGKEALSLLSTINKVVLQTF